MSFVPGWETTITINTEDMTVVGNVLSFVRSKASLPKPVFGSPFRNEIPGQGSGTLEASGHIDTDKIGAMETMFAAESSVPYVVQVGTASGPNDAGSYAGNLVITEYSLDADAEGEWDWSFSCTLDGIPVFTPAV